MTTEQPSSPDRPASFEGRIGNDESILEAIVTGVAAVTGKPSVATTGGGTDFTPLYNVVDVDALTSLFQASSSLESELQVTFRYCGCTVTVTGDSTIQIEELIDGITSKKL